MAPERALVLLLGLPAAAAAQGSIVLRYHPALGARVQMALESRIDAVTSGLPSLPDSTLIEGTWRLVLTQRVTDVRALGRLVSVRADSSRARAKVGPGARTDVPLAGLPGLTVQYQLSDRLQPSAVSRAPGADSGLAAILTSPFGGFELELPEAPLPVGGDWTAPLRFALGAYLTATGKVASSGSAVGGATVTLDSLVPRGTDTLAYLNLRGVIDPTTLPVAAEGGTGTGQFSGQVAAALVWSTGWNAVVSAVTETGVEGRIRVERPTGTVQGGLSLTISGRQQVRP